MERRLVILGIGVVLAVSGLFTFGIAYSSHQSCLNEAGLFYCESRYSWTTPTQIIGGVVTALGLSMVITPIVGKLGKKHTTSSS